MDCAVAGVAPQVDFALVGHPENWRAAAEVFSALRGPERTPLPDDEIKDIIPWIPPRAVCRVEVKSTAGADAHRFDEKLHRLHLDVMSTLAKMLAKECKDGHCEVCQSSCVKPALFEVSLSAAQLRGASLQQYLKTLDMLGIPGQITLAWVTQLPV